MVDAFGASGGAAGGCRLYDLLREPQFVVLWLVTDRHQVDATPAALPALEPWARLGAIEPSLFLIRPDNRVGFRCGNPDPARALAYFQAWRTMPSGGRWTDSPPPR